MDPQNQQTSGPADGSRWGVILAVVAAVAIGLVLGILALQVMELQFYKAPPSVWP